MHELWDLLYGDVFVPFRIYMDDGATHDVFDPKQVVIVATRADIGRTRAVSRFEPGYTDEPEDTERVEHAVANDNRVVLFCDGMITAAYRRAGKEVPEHLGDGDLLAGVVGVELLFPGDFARDGDSADFLP
ncbi:MAG: hypothetical protein JXB62_06105 [Pirellulales bacterium]|nr:hypothetical protein [Pirellulales bacterium]